MRTSRRSEWLQLVLLVAPYTIGLILLLVLPALIATPLAFTDYNGFSMPRWVGLANFAALARDRVFGMSLGATVVLALVAAPLRALVALALALLLRTPSWGRRLLRNTAFLPTVMPDVAYALVWLYIFNPLFGPLNWLLPHFGYRSDAWLSEPGPAQAAIIISMLWTAGEGIVLLLAVRRDVSPALYEAAALDGASRVASFAYITFPLLLPFLILLLCRDVIVSISASFVAATVITRGGPYYATSYLPYWAYLNATDFGRVGYAAALNLLLFGLTLVLLLGLLLFSRSRWRLDDL